MNEEPCQKHIDQDTYDQVAWDEALAQIETENQLMAVTNDPAAQMQLQIQANLEELQLSQLAKLELAKVPRHGIDNHEMMIDTSTVYQHKNLENSEASGPTLLKRTFDTMQSKNRTGFEIEAELLQKEHNNRRKEEARMHPMFQKVYPAMCDSNSVSNKMTTETRLTLPHDYFFGLALSVEGTFNCEHIQKSYACFDGFMARHLHMRVKVFLRFHSSKPLTESLYDMFAIRRFFQDATAVAAQGFKKQPKTPYYYHPKMSLAE